MLRREVNEELPADEKTTTVDEKSQDGRQLSPKQILKKIEDEEEVSQNMINILNSN